MGKIGIVLFVMCTALAPLAFADSAADYQAGVERWEALKAKQNQPCDPAVDSTEVLQGHKTPISVLILHGYTQNPQAMAAYIEFFKRYDVNILAPRLAHHFDVNIRSLDFVQSRQWVEQTQEAYESARKLGTHVIVVGYSLGGLLASRLALEPKNSRSLAALVLLSPALRLTGNVELGASVASLFSRTGNDWLKMAPPGCGSATPYLSVNGGNEVVRLMRSTDPAYPGIDGTIYKKIFAAELDSSRPVFLGVVSNDEVVDSAKLLEMATPITGRGYMTFLQYENSNGAKSPHSTLTSTGLNQRNFLRNISQTPYRSSALFDQIADFLRDWAGLDPLMF